MTLFFRSTIIGVMMFGLLNCSSEIQQFPQYDFSIKCPCLLKRDTTYEKSMNFQTGNNSHALSCVDSLNYDQYIMTVLLERSVGYTPSQVLDAIDSTLDADGGIHERLSIENQKAIRIEHFGVIETEIFTEDLSYFFVIIAKDSMRSKMDRAMSTFKLKTKIKKPT